MGIYLLQLKLYLFFFSQLELSGAINCRLPSCGSSKKPFVTALRRLGFFEVSITPCGNLSWQRMTEGAHGVGSRLAHVTSRDHIVECPFLVQCGAPSCNWLVVWLPCFYMFSFFGNNHPNWLSYFSEGWPNHQPDKCINPMNYRYKPT